jgi:hypothetical protein
MPVPIEITLYDANDEPIETYSRSVIPWGLLKKAVRMMAELNKTEKPAKKKHFWEKDIPEKLAEERQMEAISQFVVELFGNRFSVKDLEQGADVGEIMTVFQAVIARANATINANPTPRVPSKKK